MKNKVTSYQSLAMNRVDNFYKLSRDNDIISCILTIESVEVVDNSDDEVVMLTVNASILNDETTVTFNYLDGRGNASKYKIGEAWHVIGIYSMDWDNKRIELCTQKEELLSTKICWASHYARDNNLAVREHINSKYKIEWNPI